MSRLDDYVFFWRENQENGWASQWYSSPFSSIIQISGEKRMIEFTSAEQWMMVQKALLFEDMETAWEIISVETTGEQDMKLLKGLGRQVRGFQEEAWERERERIVLEGNLHKFRQNAGLRQKLLGTGEREFVEASPGDRIWGVGFSKDRVFEDRSTWGLNLLGKALNETRRILTEEMRMAAERKSLASSIASA